MKAAVRSFHPSSGRVAELFKPTSEARITEHNALGLATVYCAVNLISNAMSSMECYQYDSDRNRIEDSISDLITLEPNPFMTSATMHAVMQSHLLLWGNAYAEIERNNAGVPIGIWPLLPNYVEPEVRQGKIVYDVYANVDDVRVRANTYSYENMIHLTGLSYDGIKGYSVVSQFARKSLELTSNIESHHNNFYINGARPDGILSTDQSLNDGTIARITKSWEQRHKGVGQAHRIAVLEAGMKYQAMAMSPQDAELLATRKFQSLEIARWFNVPPHMLKDLDRATFSNIAELGEDFAKYTMVPWSVKWEHEWRKKLLTRAQRRKRRFVYDYSNLVRPSMSERYKANSMSVTGGWKTPNEVRKAEGLQPHPDGDTLYIPSGMIKDAKNDGAE